MASRESYHWTNDPHKMNNASNVSTPEGSDVVARLLNVITEEVLRTVSVHVNFTVAGLLDRITDLENKVKELELASVDFSQEGKDTLAARVRDLEERIEDTVIGQDVRDLESSISDLESRLDDIDVEQAVNDAVNDLDLTREVRDVLLGMNDEQAKEFVSKGLSSILTEANRI